LLASFGSTKSLGGSRASIALVEIVADGSIGTDRALIFSTKHNGIVSDVVGYGKSSSSFLVEFG